MEILTTDQFREQPETALASLLRGHSFVLTDRSIPVAQLVVTLISRDTCVEVQQLKQLQEQLGCCQGVFNDVDLGRLLGVTPSVLLNVKNGSQWPWRVQGRLQILAETVLRQRCIWTTRCIARWWHTSHPELGQSSPLDYLARPWQPGDERSGAVLHLVQREFLLAGKCERDIHIHGWLE